METNNRPNTKAIASLVMSCLSVINCCLWQLAILCAVVGIVLGILALRDENPKHKDLAIAGVVVGAVGLALCVAIVVLSIYMYSASGEIVPGAAPKSITPGAISSGEDKVFAALSRWIPF